MKTLADITPTPIEIVRKLAALAPKEDDATKHKGRPKKRDSRGAQAAGLGPLDLEKYLNHYGVEYSVKQDAGKTLYRLRQCLFDPSHRKNEAAIVQDLNGLITYQCFHNSCSHRTWGDARELISGEDNLAPFCAGYDPEWRPPGKRKKKEGPKVIEDDFPGTGNGKEWILPWDPDKTPAPQEVDPQVFFTKLNGRWTFLPLRMAHYIKAVRGGHIVYTAGEFWVYRAGVWQTTTPESFGHEVVMAMGENVRPNQVNATVEILKNLVAKEMDQWPTHERYVNCLDGMVDLETAQVVPHAPEYWSRAQVPCHFDLKALDNTKRWFQYLDEVWPNEIEKGKQDVLQEFLGYCLVPHCRYQRALFLYGSGANGKSVMLNVIEDMVGSENVSALSIHDLSERFNRSMLAGRLVNIAFETDSKNPASMETFKSATTGDIIKAEEKYGRPFKFRNYAKFVIAMNDPPVFGQSSTHNIMRRLLVMRFSRIFKEDEQDPDLSDRLREERDGIFMWALMGYERLAKRGRFLEPKEMLKTKKDFERDVNPVLTFIEDNLEITGNERTVTRRSEVYARYKSWAKDKGYRAMSAQKFYRHIEAIPGVAPGRDEKGTRAFRGLSLCVIDID